MGRRGQYRTSYSSSTVVVGKSLSHTLTSISLSIFYLLSTKHCLPAPRLSLCVCGSHASHGGLVFRRAEQLQNLTIRRRNFRSPALFLSVILLCTACKNLTIPKTGAQSLSPAHERGGLVRGELSPRRPLLLPSPPQHHSTFLGCSLSTCSLCFSLSLSLSLFQLFPLSCRFSPRVYKSSPVGLTADAAGLLVKPPPSSCSDMMPLSVTTLKRKKKPPMIQDQAARFSERPGLKGRFE